ncbi:MAG TPA: DNA-3-methyladenine glycosylase 2 family protein [Pseudogracilibacillus sp.]|nr:DNA-3-methyladenine glycosylase 2 family protein [Pseudogracilibacillus sp.]
MIGIAQLMTSGELSKDKLLQLGDPAKIEKYLVKIRGIGPWTVNYLLMRCLGFTSAFPIDDVGLHNAIKKRLALTEKPSKAEIKKLAFHWQGWEAYATFYLWHQFN